MTQRRQLPRLGPDGGSITSQRSILSESSDLSALSTGSILSLASAGSILSIGSAGSILSVGSALSMLSKGSIGSVGGRGEAWVLPGHRRPAQVGRALAIAALVVAASGR
ncbi:MAG: hypothetical protein JWM05_1244 [Acidimicrobiales bacterium]|nr:hypothetical protein [Acidimicrobiales bacterium]